MCVCLERQCTGRNQGEVAELTRHGGDTGIHADGWGAAFLEGPDASLFREPRAAAYSPWVQCLQDHPVRSNTVIAHIRHATRGAISLANTQPFVRELGGQAHVFAHNGHLGDAVLSMRAGTELIGMRALYSAEFSIMQPR